MSKYTIEPKWVKNEHWEYTTPFGRLGVVIRDMLHPEKGWIGVVQGDDGDFLKTEIVSTVSEAKELVEEAVRDKMMETALDTTLSEPIDAQIEIIERLGGKHGKSKNTKKLLDFLKEKLRRLH